MKDKIIELFCLAWNTFSVITGSAIWFTFIVCSWYGFDHVSAIPDGRLKIFLGIGGIIGAITYFKENDLL